MKLLRTFVKEFGFVFRMAPGISFALTLVQFLIGVLPAVQLYIGARIVDLLVQSQTSVVNDQLFWTFVVISLVLLGVLRILYSLDNYLVGYLRDYLQFAVNDRINQAVLKLDLPTMEKAETQTLITFLKEQAWRPHQMVYVVFQMIGNTSAAISYIGITMTFSVFYTFIFLIAVIPSLFVSIWAIKESERLAWGKSSLWKQVGYFEWLFRTRQTLVELLISQVGAYFAERYRTVFRTVIRTQEKIDRKRLFGGLLANMAAFVVYVVVYIGILRQTLFQILSIGQFTLYVGAFMNVERFLVTQVWEIATLFEHTKYLSTFQQLEGLQPKIRNKRGATVLKTIRSLEFQEVSYHYPESNETALSNVSFRIKAGDRVAIVGENGAGKSTLVKLMMRLYEPTSGRILINGKPYDQYTLESLRKQIGVTFQDFVQFSLTTKENIGLGALEQLDQQKAIETAAERAGIHERILRLPKQYETYLGHEVFDDGVELSGGEWQKLALARSLIKKSSILILDEPTAALDARSEYHFFQKLFAQVKKQTVIVISHRFSSVRVADHILVLERGAIAEQGTHAELMKQKGLYRELYQLQTKDV